MSQIEDARDADHLAYVTEEDEKFDTLSWSCAFEEEWNSIAAQFSRAALDRRFTDAHGIYPRFVGTPGLSVDEFLAKTYRLQDAGEIRPGIAYIFETLNDSLAQGDTETCDEILKGVDVTRLKTDLLLSFLTITFSAREHLLNRKGYYVRARRQIRKDVGWLEARRLLSALD